MTAIWKKLGRIFSSDQFPLLEGGAGYAQSPQLIVLEDRVRVYFSTRVMEKETKKFLSHVSYVDYQKDFSSVLGRNQKEIIPLGELGCFDEHGIFPFSPFQDRGGVEAYSCGWSRRVSVSVETATGHAVSHDGGETYQKTGNGPILATDLQEPFLVGDSFVRYFNGQYHMWYMYGQKWVRENEQSAPDRVYKIGYAHSKDGLNWVRQHRQIIPDKLHNNECQALPSVVFFNGLYHMVFCYRDVFGFRADPSKSYRLGYAVSENGLEWERKDDALGLSPGMAGDWDSDMMCYPHLHIVNGKLFLLYNGNAFGRDGFGAAVLIDDCPVIYAQNMSQPWDIQQHFSLCDPLFIKSLSARCDTEGYAHKLVEKSNRYECWANGKLVGLLAVYFNDDNAADPYIYISNLSVTQSHQGQGIAHKMISDLIQYAKQRGIISIRLEVGKENEKALAFYKRHGFILDKSTDASIQKMSCQI